MKISDEERLKVIKGTPHFISDDVLLKDFKWLVNQAQKLDEVRNLVNNEHITKSETVDKISPIVNE